MKNLKTEHNGPKKGSGAYWGRKWEAKKLSNKARRKASRQMERAHLCEVDAFSEGGIIRDDAFTSLRHL